MNIVFISGGNDSIALLQNCVDNGLDDVRAIYSNTGWAIDWWSSRMENVHKYCKDKGIDFTEIQSEGMESLVKRKKGWPACQKYQFCTQELKIKPAYKYMNEIDPDGEATCLCGVRREESASRRQWPEYIESSEAHGYRPLWSPLVNYSEEERNELIEKAGFDVLPHRSKECFPCICSNKSDIRMLTPEKIKEISKIEEEMGINSKGNPRVMFRPYRHLGAVGIQAVYDWSIRDDNKGQVDMFGCDSGFCGD